jgi:3-oxoacyl-[acyl-carrier protein] reductase
MMGRAFEPFDLAGKTAVVTGAARGIGRATALKLASAGANIAMGDVDESGLEATAALLSGDGSAVIFARTDVSRRSEVEALVRRATSSFGSVDVMANVAGIIHDSRLVDTAESDLDRILSVNVKGAYFCCQAAATVMLEQGSGSIVNIASSGAFQWIPTLSCYSMSKAAVVALTRVLAAEVGPTGIRVNAIAPGFVETTMGVRHAIGPDGSVDREKAEEVIARERRRNPLRIEGQPEDVANAVLYLASDASRYMTGQVLHLNGGSYMA